MANKSPTTNHPDRINNCDFRSLVGVETPLFLQVGRIKVLCAVRHVVESSHEKSGIDEQDPVLLNERDEIKRRVLLIAMTLPDRRFWNMCSDVNHEGRRQRTCHEQTAPAKNGKDYPVNQRRQQITKSITLLQDS